MWSLRPGCDLSQAKFQGGIAEHEREDLALLLGLQDRQERWRRSSIHKMKDGLQFADSARFGTRLMLIRGATQWSSDLTCERRESSYWPNVNLRFALIS